MLWCARSRFKSPEKRKRPGHTRNKQTSEQKKRYGAPLEPPSTTAPTTELFCMCLVGWQFVNILNGFALISAAFCTLLWIRCEASHSHVEARISADLRPATSRTEHEAYQGRRSSKILHGHKEEVDGAGLQVWTGTWHHNTQSNELAVVVSANLNVLLLGGVYFAPDPARAVSTQFRDLGNSIPAKKEINDDGARNPD